MNFIDLKRSYERIEDDVRRRLDAVLEHGRYIMGPEIEELETALAEFTGVEHAISCASGTDALVMALMAYGVGPGDAVFTTPFTFVATAESIAILGATPVFVDIGPRTFNIEVERLAEAIERVKREGTLRPRGVIPVDLFGVAADYDAIEPLAAGNDLFVIEDAAQSFGGEYRGRRACSFGDIATTSFFPAKPLGCFGDGGAVFTKSAAHAETLRSIRVHGQGSNKYENVRLGINGRLDSMQAAVLLAKLEVFDDELERRQAVATRYAAALGDRVVTPVVPADSRSAWAQYSILLAEGTKRDAVQKRLGDAGIPTAVYYPTPLHLQKAFADLGHEPGAFPVSEECARRIMSLPMHPYLEDEEIVRVAEAVAVALG